MSGAFSAKVDVSTKEAVAGFRAARTEAKLFGDSLNELDKIVRANKQNLILAAQQFTALVAGQERAIKVSAQLAKVKIDEARAQGIANVTTAKANDLNASAANKDAQAALAGEKKNLVIARGTDMELRREAATDRAARATQRAARSNLELHDSLSNTRYLMYDVGATYGVISAGLLAIPAATAAVSMAYQKDFAQVIRVTGELNDLQHEGLRDSLKGLANDIPVAFGELSRITQLGAQMGVAEGKLSSFTDTTARFVAVTGISADAGAQLFGRMESSFTGDVEKYPDFFERLGSSIAYVGAKTVATDPEIAALLNQIGPLGAEAGFTASEITGLSAALASVRVQPELARGTLTRIFGQLNRDVAEGSPRLNEYGKMLGMTADEAGKLWQSNPAQFFQGIIKGLNDTHVNGGNLTTTLDKLGIKASRDVSAITKLAVGYNVLEKSMDAANTGFSESTALSEMSKPIFDTAVAKLQKMANSWSNLADTLGGASLGPLGVLIDLAADLAIGLDNLIDDVPLIGTLISALLGLAAVTAVFLGFKAAQAFVIAGFVGFQQASTRGIGASMSMTGVLKQAAQTMLITKGATDAQSRALIGQAGAWKALQIAVTTSQSRLAATATVSNNLDASMSKSTSGIKGLGSSLLGLAGGPIGIAIIALSALAGGFISTAVEAEEAGKSIATSLKDGADAGMRAAAESLNGKKVGLMDGILGFTDMNKTVSEIGDAVGIGFDKIVGALANGKAGMASFNAELDEFAKKKGFKDAEDYISNSVDLDARKIAYLRNTVNSFDTSTKDAQKSTKAIDGAVSKLGGSVSAAGDDFDETSSDVDKMTDALKALNDEVFGTINAEADLQAALQKMGEGLHDSKSFDNNSEAGRENLSNFQDAMQKSRDYYVQLMADGTLTAEQAAQGYADFIQGLINEIRVQGGDTSGVEALANATAQKFSTVIGANPARVPVTVSTEDVLQEAIAQKNVVQEWYNANEVKAKVGADVSEADLKFSDLINSIVEITGLPYSVVLDALTDPAHEKSREVEALLLAITNDTYVAPVDADTTAAVSNIQNFVAYARTELAKVHALANGGVGYADGEGSMSPEMKAQYGAINAPTTVKKTVRTPVAPAPRTKLGHDYQGILDGVRKKQDEVAKSADKAAKSMEDFADGISDAARAADDYANRLKTGLTSAFNQQYALTKATDDYHSSLNAINKKRADELKQLDDLKQKTIDLNNERNKELITANKAKIEQGISLKYGEADRAADYGQQAKTALDNAAAKQKDITATNAQSKELSDGIGALTGYSDAAIANRAALRDLESKTLDMIAAYAAQGHSIDEVRAFAQNLTGQFQTDVGQMGFNQIAIQALQGDLGRYIDVVNLVPLVKPTTVEADTDQAKRDITALNDLINDIPDAVPVEVKVTTSYQGIGEAWSNVTMPDGTVERVNRGQSGDYQDGYYLGGSVRGMYSGGMVPGQSPSNPHADNMMAKVDGKGLIGIRSREFIQPEPAVDYYGQDFMEAIRTLKLPKFYMGGSPSGSSGSGSAGMGAVELGALTLKTLTDAMRSEVSLQIDAREIARASNRGNRQLSAEGQN